VQAVGGGLSGLAAQFSDESALGVYTRYALYKSTSLLLLYFYMLIYGDRFCNILVQWSLRIICAKNYENILKFIRVMHTIL